MYRKLQKTVIFVVIILLLTCAVIALIPHTHECNSSDCEICTMLEVSRSLLIGLSIATGINYSFMCQYSLLQKDIDCFSICNSTPVSLKVKLLD